MSQEDEHTKMPVVLPAKKKKGRPVTQTPCRVTGGHPRCKCLNATYYARWRKEGKPDMDEFVARCKKELQEKACQSNPKCSSPPPAEKLSEPSAPQT